MLVTSTRFLSQIFWKTPHNWTMVILKTHRLSHINNYQPCCFSFVFYIHKFVYVIDSQLRAQRFGLWIRFFSESSANAKVAIDHQRKKKLTTKQTKKRSTKNEKMSLNRLFQLVESINDIKQVVVQNILANNWTLPIYHMYRVRAINKSLVIVCELVIQSYWVCVLCSSQSLANRYITSVFSPRLLLLFSISILTPAQHTNSIHPTSDDDLRFY